MRTELLFRIPSALTNFPTSAKQLSALATLMLTGVAFVACGPSTRIETTNNTGGSGGGGATTSSSTTSSSGTTMPEAQTLVEVDLGTKSLNVLHAFDVPEHALGITAIVKAPNVSDVIGISRIRTPANEYVAFDFSVMGKMNFAFANQGWVGAATVQSDLPQAWPVQAGSWRILLGTDGAVDKADVRLWIRKTVDGQFHGGAIDVNVFAPAETGYIDMVVGNLFSDYAGLSLGKVTYLPLDSAFSIISTRDQFRALLGSSVGTNGTPALNIFVINKFGAEFGQAIGVAGGIPGSPTVHGTTMSGVAYMPSGDPNYDVTVLRHEIGHLAGLFHTTEFASEDTDPISDTVECDPGIMQSNPDKCPDLTNTMFPIAANGTILTAAQERVIQGSALYRGVWAKGEMPDPPSSAIAPKISYEAKASSFAIELSDKHMPANPTPLERVLSGVWCAHGNADYEALVLRVAGPNAVDTLRTMAQNEAYADLLRARALGAYARASAGDERIHAMDLAEQLTREAQASTTLRASALDTLVRFDPVRAQAVSAVLSASTNPLLRELSQRILAK